MPDIHLWPTSFYQIGPLCFASCQKLEKVFKRAGFVFNAALCIINPNIISWALPFPNNTVNRRKKKRTTKFSPSLQSFQPLTLLLKHPRTENKRQAFKEPEPVISIQFQPNLYCSAFEYCHYTEHNARVRLRVPRPFKRKEEEEKKREKPFFCAVGHFRWWKRRFQNEMNW